MSFSRNVSVSVTLACTLAMIVSSFSTPAAAAKADKEDAACPADPGWNEPARPRRIFGNTWYVGTCGISAILVTSPQGHVLLDTGTEQAADQLAANVRALGFKVQDIRYLVGSHEHHDHAGGMAQLQRDSGATVLAREPAARILLAGHSDRSDPQQLITRPFPAVSKMERIVDGQSLVLGPLRLTAHATPGHTQGSTSWTWRSCEGKRCLDLVYADSLTALSDKSYRFSDESAHPGVLAAYRRSLATVAGLPCDILLTPHPGASDFWSRVGPGATKPLVDPRACRVYASNAARNLEARLAQEKEGHTP